MISGDKYVLGVDFGTDSVRALLLNTEGEHLGEALHNYQRWADGLYCDSAGNQFRQHPLDYLESFEAVINNITSGMAVDEVKQIKAISVDTTGSTPVAVNSKGTPLALCEGFEDDPDAMFILWKDHTAIREAEEINKISREWKDVDYTKYVGGIYSTEWFWAKILHTIRKNKEVRNAAYSWVEHCDWFPFELTGGSSVHEIKRSRCAAGHKAMWHPEFKGLPSDEYLTALDPLLSGLRERLYENTFTADQPAGTISKKWADKLGLPEDLVIGTGAFDAHMGAVGGEIEPYFLSRVMGTSTCDILVAPPEDLDGKLVKGICGQVEGSVMPGLTGLEAGQSAFGDVYAWFKTVLTWPIEQIIGQSKLIDSETRQKLLHEVNQSLIQKLSDSAEQIDIEKSGIIALDWLNGRRTPDANQKLKAAIEGLDLGSDAPMIYRAFVEATCFGAKAIVERFEEESILIKGVLGMGGVAKKSPFVMQILADVLDMPIRIVRSEQTCALGAGMFAATAAGLFNSVEEAKNAMGSGFDAEYHPNQRNVDIYKKMYKRYLTLGNIAEERTGRM
jgi:L-ribulokinase